MSDLTTTILFAFVLIMIACALLGIGLILTGKTKFRLGMCGKDPTKKREDKPGCGTDPNCSICGKGIEDSKKTDNDA